MCGLAKSQARMKLNWDRGTRPTADLLVSNYIDFWLTARARTRAPSTLDLPATGALIFATQDKQWAYGTGNRCRRQTERR